MSDAESSGHIRRWRDFLGNCEDAASQASPILSSGHLTRINGLVMEASGLKLPLGSACQILPTGGSPIEAEVVGFNGERLFLMPSEDVYGLSPGAKIVALEASTAAPQVGQARSARRRAIDRGKLLPVGDALLGRILDGAGRPLDQLGPLGSTTQRPLQSRPVNRCRAHRSRNHSMLVSVPSMPCSPSAAGNAWAFLPGPVSARASCSA